MENITEQDFIAYEECRLSGATNMFDVNTVEFLTGLDKETQIAIMHNYPELKEKYKDAIDKLKQ